MPEEFSRYIDPLLALSPQVIFALYTAFNVALLLLLSLLTVRARVRNGVTLGDGGKSAMAQAMRAHGNASEYIPVGLILLLALINVGAPTWVLHTQAGTLTLGRVLHALGLYSAPGPSIGRFFGMILTWISMLTGIAATLYLVSV
jgi:uncharacterized membrane protein YecN with MAPEG domain